MTREEAIKYLIKPVATSTEIGEEKQKEFEAYNMAIEALSAETVQGEWIALPCDVVGDEEYKCSKCGETLYWFANYCPNCGAIMKGGGDKCRR